MQDLDEIRAPTVYGPRPIGRVASFLLFLTSLIPVLAIFGGTTVMLIYTLFVAILLFLRRPLSRAVIAIPLPLAIKFTALTILCGWIVELGAWYENYGRRAPYPALLHPQLIPTSSWRLACMAGARSRGCSSCVAGASV